MGVTKSGERVSASDKQRARAGHHAVALVLAVGGVADFFREREIGVLQRAHDRRVHADVERFQAIRIARGIEQAVDGLVVGACAFGEAEHGAIGLRDDARRLRRIIRQQGDAPGEARVKFPRKRFPELARSACRRAPNRGVRPLRHFFLLHRRIVEAVEKLRIDFAHARDHLADHGARFGRRIRRRRHAPQAMQHDAGKRVHHGGRRRDRQDVARDFDGALLRLAVHFLHALGVRHRADVPDVG